MHYKLLKGEDGKHIELGRGAMGVTIWVMISAASLFTRSAGGAARVRHPNVASVFHLGRTGQNYFYAMEFVEGETVEQLIKRSGRLDVKLALEIVTQVAAGLAAVDKQKLVHRDIKPSNIMVSLEEGGTVAAKIIDLGLAKAVNEPGSQLQFQCPGVLLGHQSLPVPSNLQESAWTSVPIFTRRV